jgi:anti-sigma B factor antagonist
MRRVRGDRLHRTFQPMNPSDQEREGSTMGEQMQLRTSGTGGDHIVTVSGEIDIASAPTLSEALVQFVEGNVVVDLGQVTFIDASGLRALIAAHRHIERREGRLIVEDMSPVVRRLFAIAGIDPSLFLGSEVPVPEVKT